MVKSILKFGIFSLLFLFGFVTWAAMRPRIFYRRHSPIISFNLDERDRLNTSIRIAAREDRLGDLEHLLSAEGANINSQSEDGVTALMYASRTCYPRVVRFLLREGADVNVADRSGRNALMYATRALCLPAVKALLKSPDLQIKMRDHRGRSVLHYARLATALEVDGPAIEMLQLLKTRFQSESKK